LVNFVVIWYMYFFPFWYLFFAILLPHHNHKGDMRVFYARGLATYKQGLVALAPHIETSKITIQCVLVSYTNKNLATPVTWQTCKGSEASSSPGRSIQRRQRERFRWGTTGSDFTNHFRFVIYEQRRV
jgi:hypothetical protein